MKLLSPILPILLAAASSLSTAARAQTAVDLHEGIRLDASAEPGAFVLSWWGTAGRTYFIETSEDLMEWTYVPLIESGSGEVIQWGFSSTSNWFFLRLRHTDLSHGGDPYLADFDEDGVLNGDELALGRDPFEFTLPPTTDFDGDGYSDLSEFLAGTSFTDSSDSPQTEQRDSGIYQQPIQKVGQRKFVSNYWYKTMGSDNLPIYEANVSYTHLDSQSNIDYYNLYEPRWEATLAGLSYSPLTGSWLVFNSGSITGGAQHLYTNFASSPDTHSNWVNMIHTRAAIRSPQAQPWNVSRTFFKYRHERTLPSGPLSITSDALHLLTIEKDQAVSNTVPLEPALNQNVERYEFLTDFEFTPTTTMQLGVDESVQPPWLMLPLNATRHFGVKSGASSAIPIRFYPAGIGTSGSQVIAQEYGTLTFTAATPGDVTNLAVGVGSSYAENGGAAKMVVYPRRTIKLALHPIDFPDENGNPITPHNLPPAQELVDYLNLVIGTQTNVMFEVIVKPHVMVNYDVGIGAQGLTPEVVMQGAGFIGMENNRLDICAFDHLGNEENAILQAAPADPECLINLYFVASRSAGPLQLYVKANLPNGSRHKSWAFITAAAGTASEATTVNHGVLWVAGRINYVENGLPTEPHAKWTIAHEIVHYIGGMGHCTDSDSPCRIENCDNELRLMTGLRGPKRATSPPRMVKAEWDQIHLTLESLQAPP